MPSPLARLPAGYIYHAHSSLAFTAFAGAFGIACALHYRQVVKNGIAGWPEEWMPSVSATIGDWAPERPFFHILIALTSGPRFLLILLQWFVTRRKFKEEGMRKKTDDDAINERDRRGLSGADWVALVGVARTFTCGGWVYITSTDHHDFHDFAMIAYLLLTIPWMFGTIALTSRTQAKTLKYRKTIAALFFGTIVPLITFFIRHKVHRIPGAYSIYSIFEWTLVVVDVAFDAVGAADVTRLQIQIVYLDGADPQRSTEGSKVQPRNVFSVGEALRPYVPDTSDRRMVLPLGEDGYGVSGNTDRAGTARRATAFVCDVYLYVCYWTIFTDLALSLFYFSVWELALSGSELALLATITPYILTHSRASRFATSRVGQTVLRTVAIALGMCAYALPGPASRLIGVSVANGALWMGLSGGLMRLGGSVDSEVEALHLVIGVLVTVVLKFVNYSINPLWCIVDADSNGWNKTGLALALAACLEKTMRPNSLEPQPEVAHVSETIKKQDPTPSKGNTAVPSRGGLIACGFGSLIFLLQTFISDASTIVAWNWSGYPTRDQPTYMTHAPIVIAVAGLAVIQPLAYGIYRDSCGDIRDPRIKAHIKKPQRHTAFGVIAFTACILLCSRTATWGPNVFPSELLTERNGFIAGSVVIAYVLQALPRYYRAVSALQSHKLFGHAMLLHVVLDVLSVVTVAYAFVPGGQLLRERGGLVICVAMLFVVLGDYQLGKQATNATEKTRDVKTAFAQRCGAIMVGILVLSAWVFEYQFEHDMIPKKYHRVSAPGQPDELFTAGIWTVHFGVDLAGRESQKRQLEVIRDLDLDVFGLLESDLHRFVYGNRDITRMLVEELGYNVDLGPGPNKHTWGAALLSRYPILESYHLLLPSPHGELAPAIHAKLLIANQTINVIVSHNGQEEDALDRQLQSEALAEIMRAADPEPFVFLGYVVTSVGAPRPAPYEIIMSGARMWDVEIEDTDRWCEYIAFRNLWRVGYARVSHGHITDTEIQAAKFIVPSVNTPIDYTSNEQLYFHTYEHSLPEGWRFPQMFRGNGTRGHRYHVFDGPLSYWPTPGFWKGWLREHDQP
ncbi:hypothetical protein NliqN6_3384 [Naganishia liquefaciens]|uniref:Uncharacterized protein n=1 Tax=Naganishia liquefaciens TaxID=104408 RepID=A0A8H3YG87_9TREE|nr:hypothetical protein NliqN6_3384 [Naganishia liquefaciens]